MDLSDDHFANSTHARTLAPLEEESLSPVLPVVPSSDNRFGSEVVVDPKKADLSFSLIAYIGNQFLSKHSQESPVIEANHPATL